MGQPRRRVDGRAKVTGQTRFADDIMLPRMLHCRLLRSTVPHARIVRIDTARAAALEGVHLVLTGESFPIPYGILPVSHDEHALCTDKVRFVGDPVAAVIARDEATAEQAVNLIEVEYEAAAHLRHAARKPCASTSRASTTTATTATSTRPSSLQFGDVDAAIGGADHVFDDVFFFEGNTHLPLEQHASVALKDPDGKLVRLLEHADAALPASRAGEGAGHAGRAHPRDCHAERRRLRRQERSLQSRSRGREGRVDARPAR